MGREGPGRRIKSFDEYLRLMKPWVLRITRHGQAPHPYLSQEDLIQDGFLKLWSVWQRLHHTKPGEDLCRIGTVAVKRAVLSAQSRARAFGATPGRVISFDEPLSEGGHALSQAVGEDGLETMRARFALEEAEQMLPALERRLLQEILAPGLDTLGELRRRWSSATRGKQTWLAVREATLAQVLGVSIARLRAAWGRVDTVVGWTFNGCSRDRYNQQAGGIPSQTKKEESAMVDELFPQEPEASPAPEPKKAPKPPNPKKKPAAAKKPAKKAPAAKKPAKKAPPPPAKGKTLAVGAKVTYLGGSRCKWLKAGQKDGKVVHIHGNKRLATCRYGVSFPDAKGKRRHTILAAKYLKAA